MKTRYFYRLGEFIDPVKDKLNSQIREAQDVALKGMQEDNSFSYLIATNAANKTRQLLDNVEDRIPEEFKFGGHDIRKWTPSNIFKETSEDSYERILDSEEEIIEDLKRRNSIIEEKNKNETIFETPKLKTSGWNFPIAVPDGVNVEEFIQEKFGIKESVEIVSY